MSCSPIYPVTPDQCLFFLTSSTLPFFFFSSPLRPRRHFHLDIEKDKQASKKIQEDILYGGRKDSLPPPDTTTNPCCNSSTSTTAKQQASPPPPSVAAAPFEGMFVHLPAASALL
ncbi:uncharacterized protein ARB_07823 [Trichophyton benhamiae CBS 112371]|uniref:Uncharacterized protein n=1 Tax=Arthroderma benhamiae (strain ATCC MYA-4681 / CBS 112371) TaxID=663331 RepID=D4AU10_ARTBC|nr:uncharacterized protein ARB_07823 [Trichophyton benhamiae CBS 112371]EFE33463.1 hypothetical protein ARB_07823 [Trichophyton benhamiae CBS 112371]